MPRDSDVYLADILEAIEKIRRYTGGMSFEDFSSDDRTVDAVVRNLEVIGEAAKQVPADLRSRAPKIEWRKVGAFRDMLIHEYFGVDLEILWDVVQTKLSPLEQYLKPLLRDSPEK